MRSGDMLRLLDRNLSGETAAEPLARTGEILRLLERYGERDPERLREIYREPVGDGDLLPGLLPRLGLLDGERLLLAAPPGLLLLSELRLLLLLLSLPCSLLPSIASKRRLLRGPISPRSSRTSRFVMRGRMRSHTRSSFSSWSTNSSMYVSEYPPALT